MAIKKTGISSSLLIHPGEAVADILEERSITREELAARMGLPVARIEGLIHGEEDVSQQLASTLERALNIPCSFWINLQANYEKELSGLSAENKSLPQPSMNIIVRASGFGLDLSLQLDSNLSPRAKPPPWCPWRVRSCSF